MALVRELADGEDLNLSRKKRSPNQSNLFFAVLG